MKIITNKSYQTLCDYLYDYPNLDYIPSTGVIHVPMDHIEEFFKRIEDNGHTYVVVSSSSDFGLAYQSEHPVWQDMRKWTSMIIGNENPPSYVGLVAQPPRCDYKKCSLSHKYSIKCHSWTRATFPEIPNNVVRWYMTNSMIEDDDRIVPIPFGVAVGTEHLFENAFVLYKNKTRGIYVNWNDYTYDRYLLREYIKKEKKRDELYNDSTFTIREPDEPIKLEDYVEELKKHNIVMCPPGNGLDCYRMLETAYTGGHIFCEPNTVGKMYRRLGFSVTYYSSDMLAWLTTRMFLATTRELPEAAFLEYWEEKINNDRKELYR